MKTVFLVAVVAVAALAAENKQPAREPEAVVRTLITAAQEDKLATFLECVDVAKVAAQPRHGMPQGRLLAFLKGINLAKAKMIGTDQSSEKPAARVALVEPISMDFDLELQESLTPERTMRWVVVGIHP
jgi:histidine ammonia-lyase